MSEKSGVFWWENPSVSWKNVAIRYSSRPSKNNSCIYLESKWPLFWLEKALFWGVNLQKQRSLGFQEVFCCIAGGQDFCNGGSPPSRFVNPTAEETWKWGAPVKFGETSIYIYISKARNSWASKCYSFREFVRKISISCWGWLFPKKKVERFDSQKLAGRWEKMSIQIPDPPQIPGRLIGMFPKMVVSPQIIH